MAALPHALPRTARAGIRSNRGARGDGAYPSNLCDNAVVSSASGCEGVSNEYSYEEIHPVTGLGRSVGATRQGGG